VVVLPVIAELRQTISEELAALRKEAEALSELRLEAANVALELIQLRKDSIDQAKQHTEAVVRHATEMAELRDELDRKESELQERHDRQAVGIGRNRDFGSTGAE
jgi:hypothetical protein